MLKWFQVLFNLILPPRCPICGKVVANSDTLCSKCFESITFISFPYCKKCGKPLDLFISEDELYCDDCFIKKSPFRLCRSAVVYDDFSKKIILDFKFFDHLENKKLLAKWILMAGKDIFNEGVDYIIPIPLHFSRLFKRKYNQSAVLSATLSKMCMVPVLYNTLKKVKKTLPQVHCSGKQRLKNIRGAFQVINPDLIKDKRILLIDDVYTTGSTLCECAKVLIKAGAKSVDALTVARVCD